MQYEVRPFFAGWQLVGIVSAVLWAMTVAVVTAYSFEVDGVRASIRATARASFFLFCLAFTAGALYRLRPNAATRWLRQNRRYLGVSFAVSHLLHALAIVAFALMDPVLFQQGRTVASYVLGGLGYAVILAMAATSFDTTAAWMGLRAWKWLHRTGGYYIWTVFMLSFGLRSVQDSSYRLFVVALLSVLAIRFFGWWKSRTDVAKQPRAEVEKQIRQSA